MKAQQRVTCSHSHILYSCKFTCSHTAGHTEGVVGLYSVFCACLAVDCAFGALQFMLYEYVKSPRRLQTGRRADEELGAIYLFDSCGMLCTTHSI